MKKCIVVLALLLAGCVGKPDGVEPVANFDSAKYLGKWYEIARFDHSFEHGLSRVTAEYSNMPTGEIKVLNRGWNAQHREWKDADGRAQYVEKPDIAHLKVSFFGPMFSSYIVFDLDPDYRYSMISGPNKTYLWILARTPELDEPTKKRLVAKAQALGFDTRKLIWVDQSPIK